MQKFYSEIVKLKTTIRRGWELRNFKGRLESDAEHTFSMLMLALDILAKNDLQLNQLKVLKMVAYHELCEIDAMDVTPADNVPADVKFNNEYAGIQRLTKDLNLPELEEIWLEFEENKTPEAQFVKALDKLDCIMQATHYSTEQNRPEVLEEFLSNPKAIESLNFIKNFKF